MAADSRVKRLIGADVDRSFAERLGDRLSSPSWEPTTLDAGDPAAVERALHGVDVVVNSSLPRFNAPIQKAALAAGAHYVDLACDSTDPYAASATWRARGLTAVVGLGEDPGLSNLMARRAADSMDRVESIKVRDGDTATSAEFPFVALFSPETFVEETLNSSRIWEADRYRVVPPFGERETYRFPHPVGPQSVYSVDHEEVDSLPRFIGKGVRYVDFKLALDDPTVRTLQLLRDLKLLERGTPERPGPRRAVFEALPRPADLVGRIDGHAALVVEVTGQSGGHRREHTLYTLLDHRAAADRFGATATAYLTGTPAAVGVQLVLEGQLDLPGLHPPESLDAGKFFPRLREKGIEVVERVTTEQFAV